MQYGNHTESLEVIVVAGNGPSLVGRNWLSRLKLNCHKIAMLHTPEANSRLRLLLEKYEEIIQEELGTVNTFEANLRNTFAPWAKHSNDYSGMGSV